MKTGWGVAYFLGLAALGLRLLSDWFFPAGGPLWYQILQCALLITALPFLPRLDEVFLSGGLLSASIRLGFLGIPLGLFFGLGDAFMEYGHPSWPSFLQTLGPIINNLFFSAVEELEFRGFLLSFLLKLRIHVRAAFTFTVLMALVAHAHRLWHPDLRALAFTLALNAWWTWLVLRTRSLFGAWVAHASWNIFVVLPELGRGGNIR